ncbi:hypothetical protein [Archangium sp.]|uniref:hypothetical protein n=1 Tax=Archangium sp. TaxID=1872627 RepID=UPI002ED8D33D
MRQPVLSLSLGLCVLSLVLVTPARAEEELLLGSGTEAPRAQLIGWSKDERRFAFRVFERDEPFVPGMAEEDTTADPSRGKDGFCKGYMDHQGKPFHGSLALRVFEQGKKVVVLPIQEQEKCTPPKKAAQRLAEAKKTLAGLGIDLQSTGREWSPKEGAMRLEVKEGTRPPFTLELLDDTEDIDNEDEGTSRYKGKLQLLLHEGGKKQVLWSKAFDKEHTNDDYFVSVPNVAVSPSGRRVVVLNRTYEASTRQMSNTLTVVAILDVPEAATAKAE